MNHDRNQHKAWHESLQITTNHDMNHHDDPKRALHKAIWLPCLNWYWGWWLYWDCVVKILRQWLNLMLDCRVGYHPKLIEDWMTGFPESFNIIWVLKNVVFWGVKKRTVSEVFYRFESFSHCFGSFLVHYGIDWTSFQNWIKPWHNDTFLQFLLNTKRHNTFPESLYLLN